MAFLPGMTAIEISEGSSWGTHSQMAEVQATNLEFNETRVISWAAADGAVGVMAIVALFMMVTGKSELPNPTEKLLPFSTTCPRELDDVRVPGVEKEHETLEGPNSFRHAHFTFHEGRPIPFLSSRAHSAGLHRPMCWILPKCSPRASPLATCRKSSVWSPNAWQKDSPKDLKGRSLT